MIRRLREIGPGAMVAAAFIGPGTVTTASVAGAGYGYTLLWAIAFSILATIILQEMAVRVGVSARQGVGHALRIKFSSGVARVLSVTLVLSAILIGNAAYEAGNLSGAAIGLYTYRPASLSFDPFVPAIAIVAFIFLWTGRYKLIERSLVGLVSLMGVVFLAAALATRPDIGGVVKGLFVPAVPGKSMYLVLGLIGTTVVPYNLFLHASAVKKRWPDARHLSSARWDTVISVAVGGMITMAIVIASAAVSGGSVASAADMSIQLQPLLGKWSELFLASGFLAAGLSSSITAPLAAAFATTEVMGWNSNMRSSAFRWVWIGVLVTGLVFSIMGSSPVAVILFAQIANGLFLPVIAFFLLWIVNDSSIMASSVNTRWNNVAGVLVLAITVLLGAKSILIAINDILR